jgi:hypothetical protein
MEGEMLAHQSPTKSGTAGLQQTSYSDSLDDLGRRFRWEPSDEAKAAGRRAGYVGSIVVNVIWYYIAHNLLRWGVPFLTPAFANVLWAIDLSIGATILANALFLAYDERWFRRLLQIFLTGLAFVVTATLYGVFPFDFGDPMWNSLASFCLFAVMIATVLATLVQLVVFVVGEGVRTVSPEG